MGRSVQRKRRALARALRKWHAWTRARPHRVAVCLTGHVLEDRHGVHHYAFGLHTLGTVVSESNDVYEVKIDEIEVDDKVKVAPFAIHVHKARVRSLMAYETVKHYEPGDEVQVRVGSAWWEATVVEMCQYHFCLVRRSYTPRVTFYAPLSGMRRLARTVK